MRQTSQRKGPAAGRAFLSLISILASREKYRPTISGEAYSQADPGASVPRAKFTPK
jgi:hypothetical protein